jgi:hypothetical protein
MPRAPAPHQSDATDPWQPPTSRGEIKRRAYAVCIRLADEGRGSEHDNSRDECCHAGIRQDFIENSGHCYSPPCATPIRAATLRSLQHRGEKVKFFEPEPLNARKQRLRAREANGDIRKSWRRSDARNLIPSPQDCPTAPR